MQIFIAKFLLCCTTILFCTTTLQAEIKLIGVGKISGAATDSSGFTEKLGAEETQNLFGGISALEYTGKDNLYLALPDRGPDDGAVPWKCRMEKLRIEIHPNQTPSVVPHLISTTMLVDEAKRNFTGKSTAYIPTKTAAERFDPEGLRLAADGSIFISDEYGPQLIQFSSNGTIKKRISIPDHFKIKTPGSSKKEENGANKLGRQCNRGMEGLSISQDGKTLIGLMQSPLLQDSQRKPSGKPTGLNCRLLLINLESGERKELLYHLDSPKNKLNEILAINNDEYLVIERDGKAGEKACYKKIIKINLRHASDIQTIKSLSPNEVPAEITAVRKEVFIDLLDPAFKLAGKNMPEKIEGLTFGPPLPEGQKTLIIASDNDFEPAHPSLFYVFSLENNDL